MKRFFNHAILAAMISAMAAACASPPEGDFPSLAKRPFEDQHNGNAAAAPGPAAPPNLPVSLPADLAADLAALEYRIAKAHAAFEAQLPAASRRAQSARGAARNSENWLSAHMQLSRLDKGRADGVAALAELDRIVSAQLDKQLSDGGPAYAQLMIPRQQRQADIIAQQTGMIDRLSRIIGQ